MLEEMETPDEYNENLSIKRQAYTLRTMLGHLRMEARESRCMISGHHCTQCTKCVSRYARRLGRGS